MKKNLKNIILFLALTSFGSSAFSSELFNFNDAYLLYKRQDYINAKETLKEYILNNPNDKDAYWVLAKTEYALKNYKNAKEYFKESYEILAEDKDIEKIDFFFENEETKGDIEDYFDMAAAYLESGNLKQAELYSDMMLELNPKASGAFFIKAQIAYKKGDEKTAKEYLNKAIFYNSGLLDTNLAKSLKIFESPEITKEMYNKFALEAYFTGKIENAIKYLKKYIEMDPTNQEVYNFLAEVYIQKGNFYLANETIEQSKKLNPDNINVYLIEARLNTLKDEMQKVEPLLLKAYKFNPNNQQTLLDIGNYYLSQKKYNEAKKYFSTLIEINDELYEGYSGYIDSLIETGEISKAENEIKKLKSLNSNSCEILYYLAKICEYRGSFNEALSYLNQAKNKTLNPKFYLEAAEINFLMKNYSDSLSDLDFIKKSKLSFDKNKAADLEIKNYLKLKQNKAALNILKINNKLDKERIIYKYNLYNMYKLQGNSEFAKALLDEVKRHRLDSLDDYIDYSQVISEEKGLEASLKILDSGLKKFKSAGALYLEKVKQCIYHDNSSALESTLKELDSSFQN